MVNASEIPVYVFDGFTLDASRRSLSLGDEEVALGSRALDLLIVLVEQAGQVLSRDHLVGRVWPRTIVEESSLRVHIAALRKALDDGAGARRYIANVPGRGYSFVGPVSRQRRALAAPRGEIETPVPPALAGREATLDSLAAMLERCPIVSIVGPGGVGKTGTAQHALARNASGFSGGAVWVDLSQVRKGEVVAHVSGALGRFGAALPALVSAFRNVEALLVLDNCEHVLEEVAGLAEALVGQAPRLRLICTSREPLNVAGEHVLRLDPLATAADSVQTLVEALQSPAVSLFVERARAASDMVVFDDADVPDLRTLCRQLDGMPLALELAAWRMPAVGLKGLLARPDDWLMLLKRGRRGAQLRHQSLRAAIEWSYVLLDESERRVLCRLAVFDAPFSLTSAVAVVDRLASTNGVEDAVLRLVDKSLLLPCAQGCETDDGTCYRLLNATRLYALEQLAELPEAEDVRARHALELERLAIRAPAVVETFGVGEGCGRDVNRRESGVRADSDAAPMD